VRIAFIPQSAYAGLNPFLSIRKQALEVAARTGLPPKKAIDRFKNLLTLLDLADPKTVIDSYPHQLSGGMRQRVLIAIALLNRPKLLIADEPTTAVDRTSQVRVLDLIRFLCDEEGLGLLIVTHDMGVAARIADYVSVLLSGLVMESGEVDMVLKHPHHPYTMDLLTSLYHVEEQTHENQGFSKKIDLGCPFANRCNFAIHDCLTKLPEPTRVADDLWVRCHLSGKMPVSNRQLAENTPTFPSEGDNPTIRIRELSVSYKSGLSLKYLFRKSKKMLHYSIYRLMSCQGSVWESWVKVEPERLLQ